MPGLAAVRGIQPAPDLDALFDGLTTKVRGLAALPLARIAALGFSSQHLDKKPAHEDENACARLDRSH
jgi:hypothetical protein